jgi:hypothetical protein
MINPDTPATGHAYHGRESNEVTRRGTELVNGQDYLLFPVSPKDSKVDRVAAPRGQERLITDLHDTDSRTHNRRWR